MSIYDNTMFDTGKIEMEPYLSEFANRLEAKTGIPIRFVDTHRCANSIYIYPATTEATLKIRRQQQMAVPRESSFDKDAVSLFKEVQKDSGIKSSYSQRKSSKLKGLVSSLKNAGVKKTMANYNTMYVHVYSFEEIAIGCCLLKAQDELKEITMKIGYRNNLGKVKVFAKRNDPDKVLPEKCDYSFVFKNDYYLEKAEKTGITEVLRNEGFKLAKKYDVFGFLNEKTYKTVFYDLNNMDKGLKWEYMYQIYD